MAVFSEFIKTNLQYCLPLLYWYKPQRRYNLTFFPYIQEASCLQIVILGQTYFHVTDKTSFLWNFNSMTVWQTWYTYIWIRYDIADAVDCRPSTLLTFILNITICEIAFAITVLKFTNAHYSERQSAVHILILNCQNNK